MIQKKTMATQVADEVRQAILSGAYRAGEQLRQERIAADMGVSRIPVREALHQLHSEGFVTLVSHKGAVVSEVSLEEILELYELRARIETWLLALAIPVMTEAHFAKVQEAIDRYQVLACQADQVLQANWGVHSALYEASARPTTIDIVCRLHQQIERYTRMMVSLRGSEARSHAEHQELLALCRDRQADRAARLLDAHIKGGSQFLIERLRALREGAASPEAPAPLEKPRTRKRLRAAAAS
jgi:DNA-binding GntR family transcriptional regulator